MTILVIWCWECSLQGFGIFSLTGHSGWSVPGYFHKLYPKSSDCLSILNSCVSGKHFFLVSCNHQLRIIVTRGQSRNETQVMLCNNYDCGQCVGFCLME